MFAKIWERLAFNLYCTASSSSASGGEENCKKSPLIFDVIWSIANKEKPCGSIFSQDPPGGNGLLIISVFPTSDFTKVPFVSIHLGVKYV